MYFMWKKEKLNGVLILSFENMYGIFFVFCIYESIVYVVE